MKIVGFAGMARAGKNEAAEYMCKKLGWDVLAFADNVKRIYCETFSVDRAFVEEWKVKSETPPDFDMPCRKGLQFIGDGFRKIKSDIWVKLLFDGIKNNAAIADVRYVNELKAIKDHGGFNVLIIRPGFENDDPNPSEATMRNIGNYLSKDFENDLRGPIGADLVDVLLINDGDKDKLYSMVDEFVIPKLGEI